MFCCLAMNVVSASIFMSALMSSLKCQKLHLSFVSEGSTAA